MENGKWKWKMENGIWNMEYGGDFINCEGGNFTFNLRIFHSVLFVDFYSQFSWKIYIQV